MTAVLLALVLATASAPRALPHGGPPLDFRFEVQPGAIELRVRGEQRVWDAWLGLGETYEEELPDSARAAIMLLAAEHFREVASVAIDGVPVDPQVCDAAWWLAFGMGQGAPGLELRFLFNHEGGLCDQLSFTWNDFREIDGRGDYFERIPVGFGLDGTFSYGNVFTWDPTYIWHSAEERERIAFVPPPTLPPVEPWHVPLGALALGAVGLAGLLWLRFLRAPSLVIVGFVVIAAGCTFALRDRLIYDWTPPAERRAAIPGDAEALELFERLHRNVYAAFGAERESDIYDILAKSVAPELLDELYGEVYESLILRDDGGARCEIERIDPTDKAISSRDPETATFTVDYAWRVYGSVYHYEHAHSRINQYRARYFVRHDGTAWRIAAVDTREHLRIGDDAAIEVLYLEEPAPDADGEDQ